MYEKVSTNLNFVEREKKTEQFWKEHDIFRKSMENRKSGETYTFYDGPPTANGKPHIGHRSLPKRSAKRPPASRRRRPPSAQGARDNTLRSRDLSKK